MWPFKRGGTDNQDGVPTEIQQYYQSEQRERMGVAWLLALVTLVVTVGVVLGLFFGGRAVYRKAAHKNNPVATKPQQASGTNTSKPSGSSTTQTDTSKNTTPAPTDTSKNVATNNPAPAPSTTPQPQPQPQPSTNTKTITNTGPNGTIAAFSATTAAGFILYELRLRRKQIR